MVASVPLNHQIVTVDWIRGLVAVSVKREGLSWESRGKPRSATRVARRARSSLRSERGGSSGLSTVLAHVHVVGGVVYPHLVHVAAVHQLPRHRVEMLTVTAVGHRP